MASLLEKHFPPGHGVVDLEKSLRRVSISRTWRVQTSFPTTREMGERYGISNASVCRLLQRLDAENVIWRRDNGRYYLNEARALLERRKPFACLIRRLQDWSRIYQSVMSGFSDAFGSNRAAMLFVHDEKLVRHADTEHPPQHATAEEQRESLTHFFHDHAGQFDGVLLDDVWLDEVLREFSGQLDNAVIVCRPATLDSLSSVSGDFDASALLAVGHLYARGYEEVWVAVPFTQAAPIDLLKQAVARAASTLGNPITPSNFHSAATPADRERLLARLGATRKRIGLFCLEDNVSLILWRAILASGMDCPARVGLLSGMGTAIVTAAGISTLQIDFEQIGRRAAGILMSGQTQRISLPTRMRVGAST